MTIRDFRVSRRWLAMSLVLLPLTLAPAPLVGGEEGAASPQELVQALRQAAAAKSISQMVPLIHPDDRPMMAFGMLMGAGFAAAFSDNAAAATADLEALQKKFGLEGTVNPSGPPPESQEEMAAAARKAFAGVDLVGLIRALIAFMDKHMKDADTPSVPKVPELESLKVEGDTATAVAGGEEAKFAKHGGRWYLRMEK